jgi:hypothetical protein
MGMFSKYRSFVHTSTLLDPNGLNLLFNLFFMKESVEKYLSSFTLSKTIAIEHSININHFDNVSNYFINS